MSKSTTSEKVDSVIDYLVTLRTRVNPQYSSPVEIQSALNEFVDKGLEEAIELLEDVSWEFEKSK